MSQQPIDPPPAPHETGGSTSGRRGVVLGGAVVLVVVLIVALLVSGVGGTGPLGFLGDADEPAEVAEKDDQVGDLGASQREDPAAADTATASADGTATCGPDERQPDLGGSHITPGTEGEEPLDVLYPEGVPSSGRHLPAVVATGAYDVQVDPRLTTHNLEHGYVVVWYDEDAPQETVDELTALGADLIDQGADKVVVAGYPGAFPGDADVAHTAWFFRQFCTGADAAALRDFVDAHYSTNGEAPEKGVAAHTAAGGGVIDPGGQDLLFAPLGEATLG